MEFFGSGSKKTVRFVNPENPKKPEKSAKIPLAGVLNVGDGIIRNLEDTIRSLEATIGELEKDLKDAEFSLKSVFAKNNILIADNQKLYAQVQKLRGESTNQNKSIYDLTIENQKLKAKNQKLNAENENASRLMNDILTNSQSNSVNSTLSTVFPQSNASNPRRLTTNDGSNNEPDVIPDVISNVISNVKKSNSNNGTICELPVKNLGSSVPEGYFSSVYYSSGVDNTDFMKRVSEMNNEQKYNTNEQNRFTFAPDCARGGLYGYNLNNTSNDGGSLNTFSSPTVTSNKTKFNPFSLPAPTSTKQNSWSDA